MRFASTRFVLEGKQTLFAEKKRLQTIPGFARLFKHAQSQEISLPDITIGAFKNLLKHCSGDDGLTAASVLNTSYAAKKYDISSLHQKCVSFVHNRLSVHTACAMLAANEGTRHRDEELVVRIVAFMTGRGDVILEQPAIQKLRAADLALLIGSSDLAVSQEILVFRACMRWAAVHRSPRDLHTLMRHCRFSQMTPHQLHTEVRAANVLTDAHIDRLIAQKTAPSVPVGADDILAELIPNENARAKFTMGARRLPVASRADRVLREVQATALGTGESSMKKQKLTPSRLTQRRGSAPSLVSINIPMAIKQAPIMKIKPRPSPQPTKSAPLTYVYPSPTADYGACIDMLEASALLF